MSGSDRVSSGGTLIRFVAAGVFNTAVTGALLSLLATVMDPRAAYSIAFVVGIALSLVLAGTFVFRSSITRGRAVAYVLWYLTVYAVGLGVLHLALGLGLPRSWSGLVVLVTATLGFLGGRLIFTDREETV